MLARKVAYFDKPLGQAKRLSGELKLVSERITAADLIRRRIEQEFEAAGGPLENHANWLVTPDRKETVLNGARDYGPGSVTSGKLLETSIDTALRGFEAQSFLLFVDNRQVESLEEQVTIGDNCTLTFIKLVPLVGG